MLDSEEKVIAYVERRKFLELNEDIKQLQTIDDHFEYAISGSLPAKMMHFNSNQLNVSSSLADLSKSEDKYQQKVIYNEGCGIAFVNE